LLPANIIYNTTALGRDRRGGGDVSGGVDLVPCVISRWHTSVARAADAGVVLGRAGPYPRRDWCGTSETLAGAAAAVSNSLNAFAEPLVLVLPVSVIPNIWLPLVTQQNVTKDNETV